MGAGEPPRLGESDQAAALRRRAATASLALASTLTLLKLGAALATGSLAVLSSLIDSLADVVASGITLISVRISQQPPDRGHRFGHGKAESLSALAQSTLVAGSALFVLIDAARRVSRPEPVENTTLGLAVMVVAIAGTLALVAFQRHVVRRTGSQAIAADSLHYKADLATNLSVVASLAIAHWLRWTWADPLIAALIALYLGGHAFRIGKEAVNVLMDHELPAEKRERIKAIVLAHPEVQGLHDLRTRESGSTIFIELHIEIDAEMTVGEAHDVTDAIEAQLFATFPEAEVILHQEPQGLDDARLDHRIARARAALR